jgi:hypothetical protein
MIACHTNSRTNFMSDHLCSFTDSVTNQQRIGKTYSIKLLKIVIMAKTKYEWVSIYISETIKTFH